jgi:hypothetical protein
VFIVLNIAVKELLNFRVEGSEPLVSLGIWEVDSHVCSRRDDVELGIKHVNPMDNPVQIRKGESNVRLILTHAIFATKTKEGSIR